MSVTGIDNVSAATYVGPHLTTVDVPRVRMGRTAVDLLLSTMHDGAPALSPILPAELIVRDSTAVAPVVVDRWPSPLRPRPVHPAPATPQ